MPCTSPIQGTRGKDGVVRLNKNLGSPSDAQRAIIGDRLLELPCGRCIDCKIERSRSWAVRCLNEAQMHKVSSFVTLTFDDEGLKKRKKEWGTHEQSLDVGDWQRFAKKLRHRIGPFRFLHVGEYGEINQRPHYHALIFGANFQEDRMSCKMEEHGNPFFLSPTLAKCWPYGFHMIGELTPETVNYVCRYVQKKLSGNQKAEALKRIDWNSGEEITVEAEYATMSRNPGLGSDWFDKYHHDVFPDDFAIIQGKKAKVPKYYTDKLKKKDPDMWEQIQTERCKSTAGRVFDQTPERRLVRGEWQKRKAKMNKERALD